MCGVMPPLHLIFTDMAQMVIDAEDYLLYSESVQVFIQSKSPPHYCTICLNDVLLYSYNKTNEMH